MTDLSTICPSSGVRRHAIRLLSRTALAATCLAPVAFLARPATAQVLLYENRLPDGYAYVRFVNTLPDALSVKPVGFADPVTLGTDGPARVSAYFTVEKVTGRSLAVDLGTGGNTDHATFELKPGTYNTVLVARQDGKAATKVVVDQAEINQSRARLAFYNAVSDCAGAGLQVEPSGSAVFSGVAPQSMRGRSVNPAANARVRAACGPAKAAPLDLGELSAGGQYSIWYMAPSGTPLVFMSENTIAPYQR